MQSKNGAWGAVPQARGGSGAVRGLAGASVTHPPDTPARAAVRASSDAPQPPAPHPPGSLPEAPRPRSL